MRFLKTIAIILAVMTLPVGSALATSERSMTPPADYDFWLDPYAGWGDSSVTPELGDSVVSTTAVAGLCVAALVGVAVADKKRRELAK